MFNKKRKIQLVITDTTDKKFYSDIEIELPIQPDDELVHRTISNVINGLFIGDNNQLMKFPTDSDYRDKGFILPFDKIKSINYEINDSN